MLERPRTRVAVLVRGFKIDEKLLHLYTHLGGAGAAYDVFLMVDDTRGRPETTQQNVLWFSLADAAALGLHYTRDDLYWLCADMPMFFAAAALPDHTHFIQLDYDLHFTRSGVRFLNHVVDTIAGGKLGSFDAIGLQHTVLHPPCDWPFYAHAAEIFDTVHFHYGPFWCLSRPAIAYLQAQRQLEHAQLAGRRDPVIAEAFVPSHLLAAGFRCVDLADIAPGSYESQDHTTSMRMGPTGLPLGAPINVKPAIEMVHPVYSAEDHLIKAVRHAEGPAALAALQAKLLGDEYGFVLPDLRDRYLELIDAEFRRKAA